jgi:CRP/FNR family cyclic AMP-dependent transcriptional regulator
MNDLDFMGLVRHETKVIALVPGQFLFQKGDPAEAMFVVRSGELQIGEGNIVFETVGPGGIVGEMAMLDASPRSASVKATSPVEVVAIDQRRFLLMLQQTPFFAIRVMRVLAERLRVMNTRVTQL